MSHACPSPDAMPLEPLLRLFDVTLDWDVNDREQGDYNASTWAATSEDAVLQVAEEMVDSGEIALPEETSPDYAEARDEAIADIVDGASLYAAIDVGANLMRMVKEILEGPAGTLEADPARLADFELVKKVLVKYIPA